MAAVNFEFDLSEMSGNELLAGELAKYVHLKLLHLQHNPTGHGSTCEAVMLQLGCIAEVALIGYPLPEGNELPVLQLYVTDPLDEPTAAWVAASVEATRDFILTQMLASQVEHEATCPCCQDKALAGAKSQN